MKVLIMFYISYGMLSQYFRDGRKKFQYPFVHTFIFSELSSGMCSASQKTILNIILAAVRTWNLTYIYLLQTVHCHSIFCHFDMRSWKTTERNTYVITRLHSNLSEQKLINYE
jgi:hypothetical protein